MCCIVLVSLVPAPVSQPDINMLLSPLSPLSSPLPVFSLPARHGTGAPASPGQAASSVLGRPSQSEDTTPVVSHHSNHPPLFR